MVYVIMSDIKGMFNKVMVTLDDRHYLWFLWWPDGELTADPETYTMNVHLFGATSSPRCASYCLRKTATENKECYSEEALKAVVHNSCVNDF